MKYRHGLGVLLCAVCAMGAENLLENGDFENKDDPLAGWTVDYAWTENSNYIQNYARVSVVPHDGGKVNVLRISAPPESKVESKLIPFDPDAQYRCTLDVKGSFTRIYFAGYRWKPGVRPHVNPHPGELRMVYKSKAFTEVTGTWKTATLEFPMKDLSAQAHKHLKQVRFICLYIWTEEGVSLDNVKIIQIH